MKKISEMSTKNKLIVLTCVIVCIFLIINIAWLLGVWLPYHGYAENLQREYDGSNYYVYSDDKYNYALKMPKYLSFNSFMRMEDITSTKVYIDEYGNESWENDEYITLFFWPTFGGLSYKIGVYYDYLKNAEPCSFRFVLNKNHNPILSDNPKDKAINKETENFMSEYGDEIISLIEKGKKVFNIK